MRRTKLLLFTPLFALAATAQSTARERPAPTPSGAAVGCIDPHRIVARHPEPPRTLVFEMAGGITYRNEVIGACPGIARANSGSIIQFETGGTRLCVNDSVRVYDPVEAKGVGARAFARCRLGTFTPVASN
jgi:hypothetical protein